MAVRRPPDRSLWGRFRAQSGEGGEGGQNGEGGYLADSDATEGVAAG